MKLDSKEFSKKEIKILNEKIKELEGQVQTLTKVIIDNGLEEEIGIEKMVSIEEKICVDGIGHLAKLFEQGSFTDHDAKMFDTLHKNLRMIRGQSIPKERKQKLSNVKELLSIVQKDK